MFYFNKLTYYMAVSAVEQLQVMASKRQYREAAAQLEVSSLSLQHFCTTVVYWIGVVCLHVFFVKRRSIMVLIIISAWLNVS